MNRPTLHACTVKTLPHYIGIKTLQLPTSWALPIYRPPLLARCSSFACTLQKLWHSSTPTWQRVEFEADFSLLGGCQVSQMPQDAKTSDIRSSMRSYKERQRWLLAQPHPQASQFTCHRRKKVLIRIPRWLIQKAIKPTGYWDSGLVHNPQSYYIALSAAVMDELGWPGCVVPAISGFPG